MPLADISLAYWNTVLIFAGYIAIITLGQYVSMSSGSLSVAHAAMAGAGAYTGGLLTRDFGAPLPIAMLGGALVGFVFGIVLGFLSVRLHLLVAGLMTLAYSEVMVVVAFNLDYLGGANGLTGVPALTSFWLVYLMLAVLVLAIWRYDTSRLGYAARACRDDPRAAAAMGINVAWVKSLTFALGAAVAALGGVLRIHYTLVETPDGLGFYQGMNFLILAVFGGSYVVWGAVFGGFTLTVLPEILRFSAADRYILYGAVLTVIIIVRPQGVITRVPLGADGGARWAWR
ncbi:MAG: branched-chain amino acid ABC transporter permease, partial [Chloroflexi bacterium]|nr:branched-chain amino acid ABC transporter permease [Chloroflexota bacterium]